MSDTTRANPTEFAILGLLAEQPRSGYDIKKEVEERLSHFWSESYGHIYPMLRRLQQRGLIAVSAVEQTPGRPARNRYAITDSGREELRAWFATPPSPTRPRNEMLLRLFMGRYAPPGVLQRDVHAYRERASGALLRLREVERELARLDSTEPDLVYWKLVVSFGTQLFETLESWSDMAEKELEKLSQVNVPPS